MGCAPLLLILPLVAAHAPSWSQLQAELKPPTAAPPLAYDAVHYRAEPPPLPDGQLVFYRERNGWCPYSERVWLALEFKGIDYATVLIDNTGGGRPGWFGGTTPRVRWPSGRDQGESLDIVKALDDEFPDTPRLWGDESQALSGAFRACFPRATRPSSRAAFLFRGGGGPVFRADFEETLRKTDALLAERGGPFFGGAAFSAADCAWAPFLERYAYQLPLLHEGLRPRDPVAYPRLAAWYDAIEEAVPAYACRVRGDAPSWAKVLSQAGFGNGGSVPETSPDAATAETDRRAAARGARIWADYAAGRPYVAGSPADEAASTILRRSEALVADAAKRGVLGGDAEAIDAGLRSVAAALAGTEGDWDDSAAAAVAYLDERVCVPRDMGAPVAAAFRKFLVEPPS